MAHRQSPGGGDAFAKKKTSVKVHHGPGGQTSLSLFGDGAGGGGGQPARAGRARGAAQPQQQGRAQAGMFAQEQPQQASPAQPRRASATYVSNPQSPFSKNPAPQHQRRQSRTGRQSQDFPLRSGALDDDDAAAADAAAPQQRRGRRGSGDLSAARGNPLLPEEQPYDPRQHQQPRRQSRVTAQSTPEEPRAPAPRAYNPNAQSSPQEPRQAKPHSSVRLHHAPGGRQTANLFGGGEPQPERQRKPAAPAPWQAGQAAPAARRTPPRANQPSQGDPLRQPAATPPLRRRGSKANIPADDSPFSGKEAPRPSGTGNPANRQSGYSPFAAGAAQTAGPRDPPKQRSSTKVAEQPGGRQSFDIFGHKQ